jgi:hypothetical protein
MIFTSTKTVISVSCEYYYHTHRIPTSPQRGDVGIENMHPPFNKRMPFGMR